VELLEEGSGGCDVHPRVVKFRSPKHVLFFFSTAWNLFMKTIQDRNGRDVQRQRHLRVVGPQECAIVVVFGHR
jgi:hypothetical protein